MWRVLLCVFLLAPVCAEELYVSNRAFRGAVSGSGNSFYVEAKPLAKALQLTLREVDGGLVIGAGGDELAGPDKVVVSGELVPSKTDQNGNLMIHLNKTSDALNAKLVRNADLGTLDLYLDAAKGAGASGSSGDVDDWDSGWQRDVSRIPVPEGPLRGKVGEAKFELIQATSFGSTLTLKGPRQTVSIILLKIGLVGGDTVQVRPADRVHGSHIRVEWVDANGQTQKDSYMSDYSMHLRLQDPTDGQVQAGIYLSLPDKSLLKGNFTFPVK